MDEAMSMDVDFNCRLDWDITSSGGYYPLEADGEIEEGCDLCGDLDVFQNSIVSCRGEGYAFSMQRS